MTKEAEFHFHIDSSKDGKEIKITKEELKPNDRTKLQDQFTLVATGLRAYGQLFDDWLKGFFDGHVVDVDGKAVSTEKFDEDQKTIRINMLMCAIETFLHLDFQKTDPKLIKQLGDLLDQIEGDTNDTTH